MHLANLVAIQDDAFAAYLSKLACNPLLLGTDCPVSGVVSHLFCATRVAAIARQFSQLAHIVTIVAAVFFTLGGRTVTCWMRALFILSH